MTHIVIIGTLPSSIINFRGDLVKSMISEGHEVTAMASNATLEEIQAIKALGADYLDYPVARSGLNLFEDLATFLYLRKHFKRINPDIILAYTIKPVIWGGIAARLSSSAKLFCMITGLGFAFEPGSFMKSGLQMLISRLYKTSLKHADGVIFQNPDNRDVFLERRLVSANKVHVVNGSGVNLARYAFTPLDTTQTKFLLIARLLRDKGIGEFIAAAKSVTKKHPNVVFQIVGPPDPSPNAFPVDTIQTLHNENIIEYFGGVDDVRPYIKDAQIYVLPSYHEGLPRTVIEAMSIGRPVITTDVPGCRETVIDGVTGYMVPHKDAEALTNAIEKMIGNRAKWVEFGREGRGLAKEKFDVKAVNQNLMKIMELA